MAKAKIIICILQIWRGVELWSIKDIMKTWRLFYVLGELRKKIGSQQKDILIKDTVNLCNELCEHAENRSISGGTR